MRLRLHTGAGITISQEPVCRTGAETVMDLGPQPSENCVVVHTSPPVVPALIPPLFRPESQTRAQKMGPGCQELVSVLPNVNREPRSELLATVLDILG